MLVLLTALSLLWPAAASPCGGVLTDPSGIIQTPEFPAPFKVPMKCQWLIDSSSLETIPDPQIVVYLTQLYLTSGLKFTEYAFYDPLYPNLRRNPTLLLEVTEENSVTTRWLLTRYRFLLIELEVERLEGNHLRVLDHLLDVFGFNITYQIIDGSSTARNDSCSVIDCSFAGKCFLSEQYREFWCSCFPEFSGPSCNYGPVCKPDGGPCLNGGICRHAGKYPTCTCPPGFTGSRCENAIFNPDCPEDVECVTQCKIEGRNIQPCDCQHSPKVEGDRWRFVLTLQLENLSSLAVQHPERTLNNYLEKQIQRFFRTLSLSRFEDLQILNISDTGLISFHFFADLLDLSNVREAQQRLFDREKLGDLILIPAVSELHYEQGLRLEDIQINADEIFENGELILSCTAQGSEDIEFSWYKDGYLIDPNKGAGGLWMEILPRNSREEYTVIFGIDSVKSIDEGRYTCHVVDWGVQECKSIYVEVIGPPVVQVSPMAASVNKGDDIDLTCVSTNQGVSYSWTRDKNLFALNPASEVWEELKPWGSILRVKNIQKSVTYTCHAQTRAATREKSVRIDLLSPGSCPTLEEAGIIWKPTAPGSLAMTECPVRYIGHAARYCRTIRPGEARWEEPLFSNCVSDHLDQIMTDFQIVSRGYIKSSLWFILSELYSWFNSHIPCLLGEGEPVLDLLSKVSLFVNNTFTSEELVNVTKVFYANVDLLLSRPNSLVHIEKVGELQKVVDQWSLMWGEHINLTTEHLSYDELVIDIIKLNNEAQYRVYLPMFSNYPRWYTANIGIEVPLGGNQVNMLTVINYQNISKFLPRLSSQMLEDGSELLYEMQSNVISVATHGDMKIRLDLTMPLNGKIKGNWNFTCARADLIGLEWDFNSCQLDSKAVNSCRCICHKPGLYGALITRHSLENLLDTTKHLSFPVVVLGCSCCLVQSGLTFLLLSCRKAFVQFLKAQFCLTICIIMAIFLYVIKLEPSEDIYQFLTILLELLFFLALSSHLAKLLIIYTEVVFIPNFKTVKRTVMGLTTGVTVLPCLISGTAESFSKNKSSSSWWLPIGSASFYTAVASVSLIICLFLILSIGLLKRLWYLKTIKETKSKHVIDRRLSLMKRTSIIFTVTVLVAISSVIFVNIPNSFSIYVFSSLSALLGFLIFLFYILYSESTLNMNLMEHLKITAKDPEHNSESEYNLFNFFTKHDPEIENEGVPTVIKESTIALKEFPEKMITKPELVTFSDRPIDEKKVKNVDLEEYPNSPKKFIKPEEKNSSGLGGIENSKEEVAGLIDRESIDQVSLAEGVEELSNESLSLVSPSEVLNRISHDLDYLLNRQPSPQLNKQDVTDAYSRQKSQTGSHLAGSIHLEKTLL